MTRYEPKCVDGTLFLVADEDSDRRVEVGTIDDVVAAVGGDTYSIEYDEKQQIQPWIDADDGVLTIDVRETATTLNHTEELAAELSEYDMDTERYGLPTRTVKFADELVEILEQQGRSED